MCGHAALEPRPVPVAAAAPERIVPFGSSRADLVPAVEKLIRSRVKNPASDLTAKNLTERAVAVWWPLWLVDTTVVGRFTAEVGYNEEVVSSEETLDKDRWQTREVTRARLRWEPRAGAVSRRFDNAMAPAMGEHASLWERLGAYHTGHAVEFTADKLAGGVVLWPDVQPNEAWGAAHAHLVQQIAADVRIAADVAEVRDLVADAKYTNPHWTWLLVPMYASGYRDDAGVWRPVWFHGETGHAFGPMMGSVARATFWGALWAFAGTVMLGVALLVTLAAVAFPPLLVLAALVAMVAVVPFIVAMLQPLQTWRHNRVEAARFAKP